MKSSIKFSLVLVSSTSLLLLCSLFFLSAEAQLSFQKLNLEDNLIRIQTSSGNPVLDIQLLENTDQCLVDCHAILKIHPYQDITLPNQPDSEFDWNFVKEKPWMEGLVSHHFELLETTEYKVEVPEYGQTLVNATCYNPDNTTYGCEIEQTVQTGSHQETRYGHEYKPFEFWGQTLEANQDYTIKLVGKKRPQLGANNIDWIPTIKGFELNEWDWWNSSWKYRRPINISVSSGTTEQDYTVKILLNSSGVGENFNWTDECPEANGTRIRFTNATEGEDARELDFWVQNCSTLGQNMTVWVEIDRNITTTNQILAYMYYGNTETTSKSDIQATMKFGDDFQNPVLNTSKWTDASGTGSVSVSSGYANLETGTTKNGRAVIYGKYYEKMDEVGTMVMEGRVKVTETTSETEWMVGLYNYNGSYPYVLFHHYKTDATDTLNLQTYNGSGSTAGNDVMIDYSEWQDYQIRSNSSAARSYLNYSLSDTITTNIPSSYYLPIYYRIDNRDLTANQIMSVDWTFMRKWHDPEPTYSIGPEETNCPSDDTYINENTKFSDIFCNVADEGNPGVLIINASDIILDCNGMTLNGTGISGAGIFNNDSNNVTVKNCTIQNYITGIEFYACTNFVEYTKLFNNTMASNNKGISFWSGVFKSMVQDNNFSGNKDYGIHISNFNGEGIESNNTFINNIIKSNDDYDLYVNANDYTFFINTTYDTEYVNAANLTRQWYLKANVTDKSMNPIENAEVTASDKFSDLEWTENTSASGLTGWNVVTEYVNQSGTATSHTPHTISGSYPNYGANSTTLNVTESEVIHLTLNNWEITFNVTSGEDENIEIDGLEIICNYTDFNQSGDTSNPYGPYEFLPGTWSCEFKDPNYEYFNKSITFNANNDETMNVTMSQAGKMTYEEHGWLEWLYNCWNSGNCMELLEQIGLETSEINQTTGKIWNQFKRTDQTIVADEVFISKVVNSTNNITINYTVNVPVKEGYGLIEDIQYYDDFLPIRIHYWFLDETNTSCYSQGNHSVALAEPYCQPLTVYTVGKINTPINFIVDLRPSLPAGNYTIVRDIEIDPNNVWMDYGHEMIGQVEVLGAGKEAMASVKGEGQIVEDHVPKEYIRQEELNEIPETQPLEGKTTGMVTFHQIENLTYVTVIVCVITLILVGLIYNNSRKRTPWGY